MASELIPSRDLRRKVALVPLVLPLELLAFHLGLSRQTLHTWKAKLEEGGLLDSRPFKVRLSNGRVVNAGTIFLVPLRKVSRVKLDRGDFEFQDARKMAQDIEEGRLSYLWLKAKRERG
ncbi:hypothetical protein ABS198_19590, partial [Acinetobacter baumannii]|uniref:hypothetical protein n=1 Tax=Acinetobacter baumannii TaxID=470 RepID=UPI00331B7D0C